MAKKNHGRRKKKIEKTIHLVHNDVNKSNGDWKKTNERLDFNEVLTGGTALTHWRYCLNPKRHGGGGGGWVPPPNVIYRNISKTTRNFSM
jgi:hypothetical protein